jgi:DNA-binding beta-propeller fold protein YncE
MMVIVAPPPFKYSHTIGLLALTGRGFSNPMNAAVTDEGILYVVNRSNSFQAPMGAARVTVCNVEGEYLGEFAGYGMDDGNFVWPTGIAVDKQGNVYVTDEHRHDVQVWDKDHNFVRTWGGLGDGDGQLNRPGGVAIDTRGDVIVTDCLNNRILKFSPQGKLLAKFGSPGSDQGQLNMPWGLGLDGQDNVYVADWRNDRVQKFSSDGKYLATFGTPGSETGQLSRPSDVAVDLDGNVCVADWGNERVSIFEPSGYPLTTLVGDADLSKWGAEYISANYDIVHGREIAADMTPEKRFWGPTGILVDAAGHLMVVETCRHRVQIYDRIPAEDY